jgi:hypothetical protein
MNFSNPMKSKLLGIAFLLVGFVAGIAAEKGGAVPQSLGGPHGGRLIHSVAPPLELLIRKDRSVEIIALTKELKPGRFTGQLIGVTAGNRRNPTKLEFVTENEKLVSRNALPEGSGYPVSVSIKTSAEGKTVYDRFTLNLAQCTDCRFLEYACICGH